MSNTPVNTVSAMVYPVTVQPQMPDTEVIKPELTTVGVNPPAKTRRRRSRKGDPEETDSFFEIWCCCFVCCDENESDGSECNCCDGCDGCGGNCSDCDLSGLFSSLYSFVNLLMFEDGPSKELSNIII